MSFCRNSLSSVMISGGAKIAKARGDDAIVEKVTSLSLDARAFFRSIPNQDGPIHKKDEKEGC